MVNEISKQESLDLAAKIKLDAEKRKYNESLNKPKKRFHSAVSKRSRKNYGGKRKPRKVNEHRPEHKFMLKEESKRLTSKQTKIFDEVGRVQKELRKSLVNVVCKDKLEKEQEAARVKIEKIREGLSVSPYTISLILVGDEKFHSDREKTYTFMRDCEVLSIVKRVFPESKTTPNAVNYARSTLRNKKRIAIPTNRQITMARKTVLKDIMKSEGLESAMSLPEYFYKF